MTAGPEPAEGRTGRRGTLRGRLAAVSFGVTSVWVLVLTVAFNVLLVRELRAESRELLVNRAEAVAASLDVHEGAVYIRPSRAATLRPGDVWVYSGSTLIQDPRASDELDAEAATLVQRGERFRTIGRRYRFYALPLLNDRERQVGTVVSAVELRPYIRIARTAIAGSAILAALLLLGVYATVRVVVRRALRPVDEMAAQADRWSADDVAQRFGTARRPRELDELARRLDGLLDRIGVVLRHEQQLASELSHELRTPLARIAGEAELLAVGRRVPVASRRAAQRIADASADMQRLIETLLGATRSPHTTLPGRTEPRALLDRLSAAWPDGPPALRTELAPSAQPIGVDGEVVTRVLSPLLDNARRYARAEVLLRAAPGPGRTTQVEVRDDGPGVHPDARDAVFEPGFRSDPDDGHHGAGLGLALSRRLARAAGGDVVAEPGSAGGVFVVTLPAG